MVDLVERFFLFCKIDANQIQIQNKGNEEEIAQIIKYLKVLFKELENRIDILNLPEIEKILELQSEQKKQVDVPNLFPPQIIQQINHQEEELQIIDLAYDFSSGVIVTALQNGTPLAKLGRVWSIIDSDYLGSATIYKRKDIEGQYINQFKCFTKRYFESKILTAYYVSQKQLVFLGTHDGFIYYYQNRDILPNEAKLEKIKIDFEAINSIDCYNNDTLFFRLPSAIKFFDVNKMQLISGGSLKKRLEGSYISSHCFDQENGRIILGSSIGELFIYQFKLGKPEYIIKLMTNSKEQISQMFMAKNSYLLCKYEKECRVFRMNMNQNYGYEHTATFGQYQVSEFNQYKLQCFLFLQNQNLFIGGYSNGVIVFQNSKDCLMSCAIHISDDPIISIKFNNQNGLFLVAYESGIKILKLGDQKKEMGIEMPTDDCKH